MPDVRRLEDYWPADPRLFVRWPIGGRMLRIHPGEFVDPLTLLRTVTVTARAIDDTVLAIHGFSLSDLIEVALAYGDWRLSSVSAYWPAGALPRDAPELMDHDLESRLARISAMPVVVTDGELEAARSIQHAHPVAWTASCSNPQQAAAAWTWATVEADAIDVALGPRVAMLGTALAVRRSGEEFPVPSSMVLSGLAAGTTVLAAEVAGDETACDRLQIEVTRQALDVLKMAPPPTRRIVDVPEKTDCAPDFAGFVLLPSERRALVVKVVTSRDAEMLDQALAAADAELLTLDVDGLRNLGLPLDPTGLLLPLVVYGGPNHEPLGEQGPIPHLHVEDLVTMVRDLDQDKIDRDVLLQFLEELVTLPGIDHFLPFDAEDVWRHWRNFGAINPTGASGVALAVDPRPDDTAWRRAAAWEPVESVLSAAYLPPSWLWSSARLDERGHATLFGIDKSALFVLTDPRLMVRTTLENPLPSLRIDASFGFGIADGIFLTFVNRPETARLLCDSLTRPLLVNIDFTADRRPAIGDQHVAIGWRTTQEPTPIIDVLLGPDWFELLADSPLDAHRAIGDVLVVGLGDLTADKEKDHGDKARAFIDEWCSAPPVAMLYFQETTRDYRPEQAFMLPRSFASRARAERSVAQAVIRAGIGPCALVGEEARRFVRDRLLPLIDETLRSLVASWSRDALPVVAEQVNDDYGERARRSQRLSARSPPHGQRPGRDAPVRPQKSPR